MRRNSFETDTGGKGRATLLFYLTSTHKVEVFHVCWKVDISTFARQQPSIYLKVPGGQSPAQTHASALLWSHANTLSHFCNRLWCHRRRYVYFTQTLAQGFILYTEISELITSSSWAYPHTYTEIMVLDALMLSAHEYALDSDLQHIQRITSGAHAQIF